MQPRITTQAKQTIYWDLEFRTFLNGDVEFIARQNGNEALICVNFNEPNNQPIVKNNFPFDQYLVLDFLNQIEKNCFPCLKPFGLLHRGLIDTDGCKQIILSSFPKKLLNSRKVSSEDLYQKVIEICSWHDDNPEFWGRTSRQAIKAFVSC